jgi:hypothetical protein
VTSLALIDEAAKAGMPTLDAAAPDAAMAARAAA